MTRSSQPWSMIAPVALACLVAGGAIGYMLGADQPAPAVPTASVPPPAPLPTPDQRDTEVAVVPESQTKPPTVAAPSAVESTAERAAAPTGQLSIRSTPTGALVTVDGRYRGETPVTIRDLPLGAHAVQIARPGHVPWSEQVTLTAGSPARAVNAALQPGLDVAGQNVGSAYVDSRPRGARVLVDGKLVGTTPFRVPGLTGGRHVIRVELEGYRAVSVPVTITPGRESRVAMTLEPAASPGGPGPTR